MGKPKGEAFGLMAVAESNYYVNMSIIVYSHTRAG